MTPVDQEFLHDPARQNGDCLRACTASILNLPVAAVPHFMADCDGWVERWGQWLNERGLCLIVLQGQHRIRAFHIATGLSPRGWRHAVVMRDGQVVHDPHPSRAGIEDMQQAFVFLPVAMVAEPDPTGGEGSRDEPSNSDRSGSNQ